MRSSCLSPVHVSIASRKQKSQVDGDALGFVSSNSWDVSGAASAGLTTFWIQRQAGEPAEELGFPAMRVVTSLADLATIWS